MSSVLRDDNINNITRNKPVPHITGRFFKYKPDNVASSQTSAKREAYNARKALRNNEFFDRFIFLFFLEGEENDWIPTSERNGLLVRLEEIVFKKSYLLTRRARSGKVKLSFFGGDQSKLKPIAKRIVTRDARLRKAKKSRVTIFSGRSLPLVENCTKEMQPIRDWLVELGACGALNCKSADEAFAACLLVLKSYVKLDGKRAYHGYPKKRDQDATCVEVEDPSETYRTVSQNPTSAPSHLPAESNGNGSSIARTDNEKESNPPDHVLIGPEEESNDSVSEDGLMDIFFGIAQDDYMYALFCITFYEDFPHKLEIASGLFLINKRSQDSRMFLFLHDILLYLHNKRTRVMDPEAHRQREVKLRHVACLLTDARELRGLQTYKEMRNTVQYKIEIGSA